VFSLRPQADATCYSQSQLDNIIKNIKAKKNTLVLGPEKIGKSTFLLHMGSKLEKTCSPILYTAANTIDLKSYIRHNLLSILKAYKDIFPEPKSLTTLSILELDNAIAQLKLSDTAKQSLKILLLYESDPNIKIEDVLKHLFTLPQLLSDNAVLLIDDAELLPNIKSDKVSASYLFELLKQGSIDAPVVMASSFRQQIEGFEELSLAPLDIDNTRALIQEQGLSLDEKALTTLYNFAEGVPYYMNYFGRMMKYMGRSDSESIKSLMDDSLSNDLHFYFTEKLKTLSPKELPILFCMAEHDVNTPSRISKLLNYSQTNVRRFLSIMEEKGFVTLKERGVFIINDPVFRRWIKQRSNS